MNLKIPAGATVMRNGSEATLGDFKAGDFVTVSHSSDDTYVYGGEEAGPGWFGSGDWGPGDDNWQGGGPWGAGNGREPWSLFGD